MPLNTIKTTKSRVVFWLTLCVALAIAVGTLLPRADFQSVPGTDKFHHFIGFAALILPAAFYDPKSLRWAVPCALLYGGAIEIIQPFVGRSGEFADLVADAIGIAIGAALGMVLHRLFRRQLRMHST